MRSVPMAKFAIVFLVLICVAPVMQPRPTAQALPIIEDSDSYAVYAALLQERAKRDPESMRDIRLLQETRLPQTGCAENGRTPNGWQSAIEKFRQANAHRWLLKAGIDLGVPYSLITPPMIEPILKAVAEDPLPRRGGGPEPGLRMLPASYIVVSAVGFNVDKTFALVGLEGQCSRLNPIDRTVLCSTGDVTPWEKIRGQWVPSRNADSCGGIA